MSGRRSPTSRQRALGVLVRRTSTIGFLDQRVCRTFLCAFIKIHVIKPTLSQGKRSAGKEPEIAGVAAPALSHCGVSQPQG
ncbi:MAG: hypothetical protein ACYDDO_15350 [Acidiferrobacterales bacterium]